MCVTHTTAHDYNAHSIYDGDSNYHVSTALPPGVIVLDGASTCNIVKDAKQCSNIRNANITIRVGGSSLHCSQIGDVYYDQLKLGGDIRGAIVQLEGFDYRVEVDKTTNVVRSLIWQTGRMRARTLRNGEMLFFDGKERVNREKFPIFLLTCVNSNKKIGRAAVGLSLVEDGNACQFMLRHLRSMTPGWGGEVTVMMDAKLSEACVHHVLPDAHVMVCTWHWLELNLTKNLMYVLGALKFEEVKNKVYAMKGARSKENFEELWEALQQEHPKTKK